MPILRLIDHHFIHLGNNAETKYTSLPALDASIRALKSFNPSLLHPDEYCLTVKVTVINNSVKGFHLENVMIAGLTMKGVGAISKTLRVVFFSTFSRMRCARHFIR